jgi:hypothetical protein
MSLIPLAVLLFIVMVAFGGPDAFVRTVSNYATDIVTDTASWIRHF